MCRAEFPSVCKVFHIELQLMDWPGIEKEKCLAAICGRLSVAHVLLKYYIVRKNRDSGSGFKEIKDLRLRNPKQPHTHYMCTHKI